MVDPTDKDTKHIKDRSMDTEVYLEYTKENENGKVTQLLCIIWRIITLKTQI